MGAKRKHKPAPQPNRNNHSLGWRHAIAFSVAAALVSLILWPSAQPIRDLAVRLQLLEGEPPILGQDFLKRVRERLGRSAPAALVFYRAAVSYGTAPNSAEATGYLGWLGERDSDDPDNAVYAYLEAGVLLNQRGQPADSAARFALIDQALARAAAAGRCAMYDGEELDAWRTELRREKSQLGHPAEAARMATNNLQRLRPSVVRSVAGSLTELGRALAVDGHDAAAQRALDGARDLCLRTIASSRSESLIRLCATQLVEVHTSLSDLAVRASDWPASRRFRKSAEAARRFGDLYRSRVAQAPTDYLSLERRAALRPQPYLAALTALIVAGVFATGALVGFGITVVSMVAFLLSSIPKSDEEAPAVTLPEGRWSWPGTVIAALAPALLFAVVLVIVPIDPNFLGAMGWLGTVYCLVTLATAATILTTARRIVLGTSPADAGRWVWQTVPAVVTMAILLIVIPQASISGTNPAAFDASWTTDRSIVAARAVLNRIVIAAVAGSIAWFIVRVRFSATTGTAHASYWRTVVVVAALTWLLCASSTLLATRTFNHLDRRYAELVYEDLADEVTARMGPRWREAFFTDTAAP